MGPANINTERQGQFMGAGPPDRRVKLWQEMSDNYALRIPSTDPLARINPVTFNKYQHNVHDDPGPSTPDIVTAALRQRAAEVEWEAAAASQQLQQQQQQQQHYHHLQLQQEQQQLQQLPSTQLSQRYSLGGQHSGGMPSQWQQHAMDDPRKAAILHSAARQQQLFHEMQQQGGGLHAADYDDDGGVLQAAERPPQAAPSAMARYQSVPMQQGGYPAAAGLRSMASTPNIAQWHMNPTAG
jgi:hypothetical protein